MENWNDATFARQWAAKNTEENPARKPALDLLLQVLADYLASAPAPRRILDLGCGHGVIAARVQQEIEGTTLVGVDGSAPCSTWRVNSWHPIQTGGACTRLTSRP